MRRKLGLGIVSCLALAAGCSVKNVHPSQTPVLRAPATPEQVTRVTTAVPFPRGLQMGPNGDLYVLSRGRVRDAGGTDVKIIDQAGTIWRINPDLSGKLSDAPGTNITTNATAIAIPTEPPFHLLDRTKPTALDDTKTDRPYCGLAYDAARQRFYICAFSGIDKPLNAEGGYFRKNKTDAVLAYDVKEGKWEEVWRGAPLEGADNCLVVGDRLFVVTKDNSKLLEFDARKKGRQAPREAAANIFNVEGLGTQEYLGHSMLAYKGDGYLYLGFRTSSTVVRIPMRELGKKQPNAQLLAQFEPFDPATRKTADLTDMCFGPDGALYVVSAKPARVFRFNPDPANVFDGRDGKSPAWADLSKLTGNAKMKSENVHVDSKNRVFVTSADQLPVHTGGVAGVIYRIDP